MIWCDKGDGTQTEAGDILLEGVYPSAHKVEYPEGPGVEKITLTFAAERK